MFQGSVLQALIVSRHSVCSIVEDQTDERVKLMGMSKSVATRGASEYWDPLILAYVSGEEKVKNRIIADRNLSILVVTVSL